MPLDATDVQALAQALQQLPPANNPAPVNAISLKLPEFWPDDPEVWFARVESQFATRGITQDGTKFDYIVSALDNPTASEIKAVILHPPTEDKYNMIKKALLEAFSRSQAQKDAELLSLSGLGDKKPTAFLRKIRSLNNDAETLRRAVFLSQLPSDVRSVLAGQNITDLDELAQTADRIMEVRQPIPAYESVSAVSQQTRSPKRKIQNSRKDDSFPVCFYHSKYGGKARRCKQGCRFAENTNTVSASNSLESGNDQAGR